MRGLALELEGTRPTSRGLLIEGTPLTFLSFFWQGVLMASSILISAGGIFPLSIQRENSHSSLTHHGGGINHMVWFGFAIIGRLCAGYCSPLSFILDEI